MAKEGESGQVAEYLQALQKEIVAALSAVEAGKQFVSCPWESRLGAGIGMVLEGGQALERGGVSFSQVSADSLPSAATAKRPELNGQPYRAMGVSLVLHPRNPFAPTVHMNVRFFSTVGADPTWWFGGGVDLTPHYGFEEDCRHFHAVCKDALDSCDTSLYPVFKKACDEYFFIRHRSQMRGVGGVFFDDYTGDGFASAFAVMQAVGDSFLPAYLPVLERRKDTPCSDEHRAHQLHRRSRYVEFNLLQDRGTMFGLQSGGKADAILMSMPPLASWDMLGQSRNTKDDDRLHSDFLQPKDWLADTAA